MVLIGEHFIIWSSDRPSETSVGSADDVGAPSPSPAPSPAAASPSTASSPSAWQSLKSFDWQPYSPPPVFYSSVCSFASPFSSSPFSAPHLDPSEYRGQGQGQGLHGGCVRYKGPPRHLAIARPDDAHTLMIFAYAHDDEEEDSYMGMGATGHSSSEAKTATESQVKPLRDLLGAHVVSLVLGFTMQEEDGGGDGGGGGGGSEADSHSHSAAAGGAGAGRPALPG